MVSDSNVRSLPQILAIAKKIIEKGKEKEFIEACSGQDAYFVVGTDATRTFLASFMTQHGINPNEGAIHGFQYGNDKCT